MPHALTGILHDIAAASDEATALKIAQAFGGIRVYIPPRPGPGHWLTEIAGAEKAHAIASALVASQTGLHVLIPMGPGAKAKSWKRLNRMIDEGEKVPQIARACGVHMRTVYLHKTRKLKRVAAALRQPGLFD